MECIFCGEWFLSPNGRKYCSDKCRKRQWRLNNPDKNKAQQERDKNRRYSNPEIHLKFKKRNNELCKLPKYRYSRYKAQAKDRNYPFKITFEQFMTFWEKDCHYCGDKINGIGIDRLDNTRGYFMDNCVPCCEDCNRMKMDRTLNGFIEKCAKIFAYNSKK